MSTADFAHSAAREPPCLYLNSFDALSEAERREVLEHLLRRAAELPYSFPSDNELVRAADAVFQDYDSRETKG